MYNKYYIVEWTINLGDICYSDRKGFEANEEAEMAKFIFNLAHKKGVASITKNTYEKVEY